MSLRINHAVEEKQLSDEITKLMQRLNSGNQRKSSAAKFFGNKHCIRIQKLYPNERIDLKIGNNIEFSTDKASYVAKISDRAEFVEEIIFIVDNLKELKRE